MDLRLIRLVHGPILPRLFGPSHGPEADRGPPGSGGVRAPEPGFAPSSLAQAARTRGETWSGLVAAEVIAPSSVMAMRAKAVSVSSVVAISSPRDRATRAAAVSREWRQPSASTSRESS